MSVILRPLCVLVLAHLCACQLIAARADARHRDRLLHVVRGDVQLDGVETQGSKITVAILRGEPLQIYNCTFLDEPGRFELEAEPGEYVWAAFIDSNRDGMYTAGEHAAPFDATKRVHTVGQHREGVSGPPLLVRANLEARPGEIRAAGNGMIRVDENVPLSAARFGQAVGAVAAWRPMAFIQQHGAGVFRTAGHRPGTNVVVFVHGFAGYPQEFTSIANSLNPAKHQVWVAQYPSGWELDRVATYFARIVTEMRRIHPDVPKVCVVAHSMGGLVVRESLNDAAGRENGRSVIDYFASIASPFDGHPSAAQGVARSPVVLPAWRALAPSSVFLRDLFRRPLGSEVHRSMFIASIDAASDGNVSLFSQKRAAAIHEAATVESFHASHVGVLSDPALIASLNRDLETNCN